MFTQIYKEKFPKSISIIMDGNGTWSEKTHLKRFLGHYIGGKKSFFLIEHCFNIDLQNVTLYTFSHENWGRHLMEVKNIFAMLYYFMIKFSKNMKKKSIKFYIIGQMTNIPLNIKNVTTYHSYNIIKKMITILALSYGGRNDIINGMKKKFLDYFYIKIPNINEVDFNRFYISTKKFSEPDVIIRFGNQSRLSNFLLWQASYTELFFLNKLWPDYSRKILTNLLKSFAFCNRKFGVIKKDICVK